MTKLSASPTHEWDVTIEVRGVAVPTLSPMDAADVSVVRNKTREELLLEQRPWPGVFRFAWRMLFGHPLIEPHLTDDAETEHVRKFCKAFIPSAFHQLVDQLTGGELLIVQHVYLGAQQEWCLRIGAAAAAEFRRQNGGEPVQVSRPAREQAAPLKMHGASDPVEELIASSNIPRGSKVVRVGMTPLRHGQPHPLFTKGLGG